MRYKATREQSAEVPGMVLPLMARHSAGFHPLSYNVCYGYAAGLNPDLRAAVEARLAQTSVLTDRDIEALFDPRVALRAIDSCARMRAEIARMIDHLDGAAVAAGQKVQQYGNELDGYRERLRDDIGKESFALASPSVPPALRPEGSRHPFQQFPASAFCALMRRTAGTHGVGHGGQ
jgi:hypothetical protein